MNWLGTGAGGGGVDAEAMQCDRRGRTAQRWEVGGDEVDEQLGENPVGSVRSRFVGKKRVSGSERDALGSSAAQRSGVTCAGGEKCCC